MKEDWWNLYEDMRVGEDLEVWRADVCYYGFDHWQITVIGDTLFGAKIVWDESYHFSTEDLISFCFERDEWLDEFNLPYPQFKDQEAYDLAEINFGRHVGGLFGVADTLEHAYCIDRLWEALNLEGLDRYPRPERSFIHIVSPIKLKVTDNTYRYQFRVETSEGLGMLLPPRPDNTASLTLDASSKVYSVLLGPQQVKDIESMIIDPQDNAAGGVS